MPELGVGIDFGTSNSAAAIYDGESVMIVPLEESADTVPSAVYIDRKFTTRTGQAAIDEYVSINVGRRVELAAEVLGEARTSTGQIDERGLPSTAETKKVYGRLIEDHGMQGRLFRGIKRLLADSDVRHLSVFDRPFRPVALLTPLLVRVRNTVQEFADIFGSIESPEIQHACVGHPVNFEAVGTPDNALALERLAKAYRHAGITRQQRCPEPIAATLSYLAQHPVEQEQTVLAVDFGGGTLDLCVLKAGLDHFEVVAVHGIGLGGDHIDRKIYEALIFPLIGKGERITRQSGKGDRRIPFSFSEYGDLLANWVASYMLNQARYIEPIVEGVEQGGPAAEKFRRLLELIRYNYNYQVFQFIQEFKAELSSRHEATLDIAELDIEVSLTRVEFELLISEELEQFEQAVRQTLNRAGYQASDIDLVVRTGGSSLIPAVEEILQRHFPGRVIQHDPLTSVAAGLAIASYHGYQFG